MTSLLTFYLKGKIEVSKKSVSLSAPNTILKFIPLGSRRFEPMVSQIAAVNSSFHLDFKSFVVGIIIALFGLSLMGSSALLGLILLVLGTCQAVSSFETVLEVRDNSGASTTVVALIFDKNTIEEAEKEIKRVLAMRSDDTNSHKQTDRIVDAINSK